ncbi:MFS transporter [Pandoraea anapnoica]|uniref:MFS transporter n=1 Tax=Pandoraea anapnoica TaxID=2508301 RepID=A0A5E5AMI5_9BURK|nr:MFS transporter [Pandoraea anapnoica]VVE74909.1 MFS transporter [Pandoraea anapnoica]
MEVSVGRDSASNTANTAQTERSGKRIDVKVIAVSTVGNALEWFDFTVFTFFAANIARQFFPSDNPTAALLAAWTTFGVGFLTRPLGGIVLGAYADKHGRKAALLLTITVMALGVAVIAFAPTYAQIGMAAPVLMLIGRFLQGFSAGGEVGSATAFLVEHAPVERRGVYGSFQMIAQACSMLLGAIVSVGITQTLTPEQIDAFGWRIPFVIGLLIVPVGLYVRSRLDESPVFKDARKQDAEKRSPFIESVTQHWRQVVAGFGLTVYGTIGTYIFYYYMPSYATKSLGIPFKSSVIASLCAAVAYIVGTFASGRISDAIGRKKPMTASALISLIIAYPLFLAVSHVPTLPMLIFVQCCLMLSLGLFQGSYCAFVCELFPSRVRATSMAIGYNFAVMIFGGFAGAIATLLIGWTGDKLAVVYYGLFGAAVGLVTILMLKDRSRQPLL